MDIKIIEEKENALFDRREISGNIEAISVPSRQEVTVILSKKFNSPEENIKIKKIEGKFGSQTFNVKANIYSSKENKDSLEIKKKKDEKILATKAQEAAAKQEPAPEQKTEEPKEETASPKEESPTTSTEEKETKSQEEGK
ncbi:MAG: hypothetical protein Q8P81_00425 [Nanoarchaeota archaeon]|nr:hypothetical protein [Nanoarchaeota archaeon]